MIWQACGRRGSGNQQKGFDVAVFVKMGLQVGLQGVPGGAQGEKKSSGAPPAEKKQGRREKIRGGRGMGEEKELWCPAVREKAGKKREKLFWAGHGRRKRAVVPRRQRKNREEERKSGSGGAWGAKGSSHTPPAINK